MEERQRAAGLGHEKMATAGHGAPCSRGPRTRQVERGGGGASAAPVKSTQHLHDIPMTTEKLPETKTQFSSSLWDSFSGKEHCTCQKTDTYQPRHRRRGHKHRPGAVTKPPQSVTQQDCAAGLRASRRQVSGGRGHGDRILPQTAKARSQQPFMAPFNNDNPTSLLAPSSVDHEGPALHNVPSTATDSQRP